MRERDRETRDRTGERDAETAATPGRTTLVEQDRAHETAMLAYLAAAQPGRGSAKAHATPATAAQQRLTGGEKPDHAFDVEHAPKHPYLAKHDALNRNIHDPRGKHVALGRPGVTIGKGDKKHDELELVDERPKQRYLIATNSDGHHAMAHDVVTNAAIRAHDGRFAVNPAHVRELILPGDARPHPCVLSWFGTGGAAWIRTADLEDGSKIGHAANRLSHADNPHAAEAALHDTTRFVIRSGGIAVATTYDHDRYMGPHQKSTHANHKSDYLERATGEVNLVQTLPGGHAAAVAIDVLMPGQYFFVPNEADHSIPSKYVREVAVYRHGAGRTKEREVWVFGFVGKSAHEPDRSRAGWLPLRVVQAAPL